LNIKYSIRPVDNDVAVESIFETYSLIEALQKVGEHQNTTRKKCIIVSCPEDPKKIDPIDLHPRKNSRL